MPTVKEGNSIQHYGTIYPSIWRKYFDIAMQLKHLEDTTFSTGGLVDGTVYGMWVGPISRFYYNLAWHTDYIDGHSIGFVATGTKHTRCVRTEKPNQVYLKPDFVDNKNGTISDKLTKLVWVQKVDTKLKSWEESIAYCENLEFAGRKNWKLPDIKELQSLADHTKRRPSIDTKFFVDFNEDYYWSNTHETRDRKRVNEYFRYLT